MIIDADVHIATEDMFDRLDCQEFVNQYKKENSQWFNQIDTYEQLRESRYHVDRQLLNIFGESCGLSYRLPDELAISVMQCYNDYMIELSKTWNKFDVNLWLAMQNPVACLQELNRLQTQSFFGVYLGEQVPWGYLPEHDEIFAWLETNGVPVYIHFAGRDDIQKSWFANLPQIYYDFKQIWLESDNIKLTMLSLIQQTLPKFPNLKIVIAEQGIHWLKNFCHKIQEQGLQNPYPILKTNFWFTCEPEHKTFLQDAEFIGWDRVLFATDAPHYFDKGGKNADHDVELIKNFLKQNLISDKDYSCFTEHNYKNIQQRVKR